MKDYDSYDLAPQIGYWHCFCCEHDLGELKTEEDVQEVLSEREYSNARVWRTLDDALRKLAEDSGKGVEELRTIVMANGH